MLCNSDQIEQVQRSLAAFHRRIHIAEIHGQHHILQYGEGRQKLEKLEHYPHMQAAPVRHLALTQIANRHPADDDLTRSGSIDPGEHIDQCRFAAPRFSDHGDEFPSINLQVNAL